MSLTALSYICNGKVLEAAMPDQAPFKRRRHSDLSQLLPGPPMMAVWQDAMTACTSYHSFHYISASYVSVSLKEAGHVSELRRNMT